MKLQIIIGSTRPGRIGPKIADWFAKAAEEHGKFEVDLVDIADFNLPVYDEPRHPRLQQYEHEHTKRWSARIEQGDAYVFVTPEYNYIAPSSLINAVGYLVKEWGRKPAAVVSYGGISGGLRAAQTVRQLISSVNVMPIPQGLPIPLVFPMIGEDGIMRPTEQVAAGVAPMLDELAIWADGLKKMRASLAA